MGEKTPKAGNEIQLGFAFFTDTETESAEKQKAESKRQRVE